MSFLPYGRARSGDWLSAVGVSVLTHGGIVALLLTASVPLLPTIRPEGSAEGDLIVSLEILDAVIASEQDTDDLPLTELEESAPDTLAPVDPASAETLVPEEDSTDLPAETLETAPEETLLPEETEPEDHEAVVEAEPEVTEAEVTEAAPVEAEDLTPVEPEVAEAGEIAPQTPAGTLPETAEVIEDTPDPEPAPESALSEARLPRLSVWERHAPGGHACTEVYFDKIEAELRPVPLVAGNRFKTSQGSALCGILLRMELGPNEIYAAAGLELLSGRFVGALRPPPDLSGRRSVKGRHEWSLDLPHRVAGPVRYRLSLTTSSTAIRAQNQPGAGKTITLEHEVLQ